MFSSSYYKLEAKKILRGNNFSAMVGTFIYTLPMYVLFLLQSNLSYMLTGNALSLITVVIETAYILLVSNILDVGYRRFLGNIKPKIVNIEDPMSGEVTLNERTYSFNHIVSGYTMNFKNTFKIMFLRRLYMFGWGLFASVPLFVMTGIIAYLAATTDIISTIYSYGTQLMTSPSPDMLYTISDYISANCPYLPAVLTGCMLLMIPMSVPYIRKHYEYFMIPMILADNPDIDAKEAFKLTSDIMIGHRMRFFILQLSFFGYYAIMFIFSFAIIPLLLMFYITPYTNMAYIQFYKQRKENVEYNGRN